MTLAQKQERELHRAIKRTLRTKTLREASKILGIPRTTLHEQAHALGLAGVLRGRRRGGRAA